MERWNDKKYIEAMLKLMHEAKKIEMEKKAEQLARAKKLIELKLRKLNDD